jgi:hypothetical protein
MQVQVLPISSDHATQAHASEELLEDYCFRRISEPLLSMLEEHLLICGPCRAEMEDQRVHIAGKNGNPALFAKED